jgi:hypothetical protein
MIRNKLENILRSIFSVFIMIAIAGGAVIFVLFIAAIIIGGAAGEALAVNISKIYLPYFIRSASIAVISGLLMFYVGNCHTLSLEVEKKTEATE